MDNGQYQKLHSMVKEALSELKNLKNILSQIDYNVRVTKSKVKGFSLVELMIVVAIIGVLTAIAIPNFQTFQARSRMSEARAGLTSLYTALQAFHAQWEVYAAPFQPLGYEPEGEYLYAIGFDTDLADGIKACGLTGGGNLSTANVALGCGPSPQRVYKGKAATASKKHWNTEEYCTDIAGCDYRGIGDRSDSIDVNARSSININSFVAVAVGDPKGEALANTSTAADTWTINHNKKLEHENDVLN